MGSLLDETLEGFSPKNKGIPPTRKETIQAELKLLEWHKLANAAAIKAALLQTKGAKQHSPPKNPKHKDDDAKWIKKVIQQEHIKPLEVTKQFVLDYETTEKEHSERLTSQVNRHISTLKNLRVKLEARADLKERTEEYRQWQKGFAPKKLAVMSGLTIDDYNNSLVLKGSKSIDTRDDEAVRDGEINDALMNSAHDRNLSKHDTSHKSKQELSTVLDSLSRLADLQNRISNLEKENQYDHMKAMEQPSANQRTSIEFIKKRADPEERGPKGMVYELRNKKEAAFRREQQSWKVQIPGRMAGAGGGIAAVRARQRGNGGDRDSGVGYDGDDDYNDSVDEGTGGPGIFITEGDGNDALMKREAQRKDRQRQLAQASQGQKNLRTRLQLKKGRQMEKVMGAKKHEEAMREMARRKNEAGRRNKAGPGAAAGGGRSNRVVAPGRGMASGVRTKNKHLQDFEKMKAGHKKRKDEIQRGAIKQEGGTAAGGGAAGIENRFVSQTAPAYSNTNHPMYRGGRAPTTKVAGTATRRTDNPTRRPNNNSNNNNNVTDPLIRPPNSAPIAVTGMGGLRVIKANAGAQPLNNRGRGGGGRK